MYHLHTDEMGRACLYHHWSLTGALRCPDVHVGVSLVVHQLVYICLQSFHWLSGQQVRWLCCCRLSQFFAVVLRAMTYDCRSRCHTLVMCPDLLALQWHYESLHDTVTVSGQAAIQLNLTISAHSYFLALIAACAAARRAMGTRRGEVETESSPTCASRQARGGVMVMLVQKENREGYSTSSHIQAKGGLLTPRPGIAGWQSSRLGQQHTRTFWKKATDAGSPPCSPQMPSLSSGLAALPRSMAMRICWWGSTQQQRVSSHWRQSSTQASAWPPSCPSCAVW